MSTSHTIKIEVIDIENNVYYKDNPKFFLELKLLVEEHPCHFSRILKYTRKDIRQWIDNSLLLLDDPFYQISTKINWILNGRTDFPFCPICNKQDNYLDFSFYILYNMIQNNL